MANIIKIRRGVSANLSTVTLQDGEMAFTTDTKKLYIGNNSAKVLINPDLGTAATKDTGTSSGNVPVLGSDGKLDANILPAIAVVDVFEVANVTAMLALNAQIGDVAIRTDENKSYILGASPANVLANWKLLRTPTDSVLSVAGKTGAVTLDKNDVGLGNVTNESKATMFTSPTFTGTPTAPNPPVATNNQQIATTNFVKSQGYLTNADLANISIDGGTF